MSVTSGKSIDDNTNLSSSRLALYRKYRPTNLDEVIGQPQVTDILKAAVKKQSFAHAYLFTGQRGTGKTTVARILAHLVNNIDYSDNIHSDNVDIIEIDAASNNGVDDVRQIREGVNLAPMVCQYKVYVIDEFHMLSKPAFNALLKTIEEPPSHIIFILATTELQKVPATILSRVQRFHFRPLSIKKLSDHLRRIADQEGIIIDDKALSLIAKSGGGSVRDAITLLDQISNHPKIDEEVVCSVLGLISDDQLDSVVSCLVNGQANSLMKFVREITSLGISAQSLANQLIYKLTDLGDKDPSYYYLINQLLEVEKSTMPETKLLAILVNSIVDAPIITNNDISDTKIISDNASKPKEKINPSSKPQSNQSLTKTKTESKIVLKNKTEPGSSVATTNHNSSHDQESDKMLVLEKSLMGGGNDSEELDKHNLVDQDGVRNFSWDDILQKLTDNDKPSVRSLLEQADFRYSEDRNTLTLFFSKAFHRKRANSNTFRNDLLDAVIDVYNKSILIEVSNESFPPDSSVAEVLNIVGGEVIKTNG